MSTQTERPTPVRHISTLSLGTEFDDLQVGILAVLHRHPEHPQRQPVEVDCPGLPNGAARTPCPTAARFSCMSYFSQVTVCDDCRAAWEKAERMARMKKAWEMLCPAGLRDTDKEHAGFPKAQYEATRGWDGGESLVLYGPTGKGKTRLAMLLLKRAMLRGAVVGVLWPERVRSLTQGYDSSAFDHYTMHDVLLLDDTLLTACRESRMVETVKQLIDVRIRDKKTTILTTQVATEQDLLEAKEFGEGKGADLERIKAILRRLRENAKVIGFGPAGPAEETVPF